MNSIKNPGEMEDFLRSINMPNIKKSGAPIRHMSKTTLPKLTASEMFSASLEQATIAAKLIAIAMLGLSLMFGAAYLMS